MKQLRDARLDFLGRACACRLARELWKITIVKDYKLVRE